MTINIEVSEELRHNGIGEKLLKFLADEAKKRGVTTLNGNITNVAALKTRVKVFGDSLNIFMPDPVTGKMSKVSVD